MNLLVNQKSRYFGLALHGMGALLVALIIGLFYGFVYRPLERQQEQSLARIEQLDQLLQHDGSEGRAYRRLRNRLDDMKASVAELHSQLAEEFTEASLLAEVQTIAAQSNVEIVNYQVGIPQQLLTHSLTEVEFDCSGSFDSVCKFLNEVEQISKITKLSKIDLKSRSNSRTYPFQLTFVLYSGGESNDTRETGGVL